jgi:hypothetical protein
MMRRTGTPALQGGEHVSYHHDVKAVAATARAEAATARAEAATAVANAIAAEASKAGAVATEASLAEQARLEPAATLAE